MDAEKKPSIFLSHNSKDKPFARRLASELERSGARVWIDEAEILVGDSLIRKIEDGISSTDYLGVVLSPNSVNSPWVQREVETALTKEICGKRVFVLPFLYQDCEIPPFLSGKAYADFRTDDGYYDALNAVKKRLKLRLTESSPNEPPKVPEEELRTVELFTHDMMNSLVSIQHTAHTLLRHADSIDPKKQRRMLEDIAYFSEHAGFQERQYSLLRTYQDGTYRLRAEHVPDFMGLLKSISLRFKSELNHRGLHLRFSCSNERNNSIVCDKDLIAISFRNLLQNAIKYSWSKTEIFVSVVWRDHPEFVEIQVSNHGAKVKPSEAEDIFEAGYRSEHAMRLGPSGTGLGLFLAKSIARSHGGDVEYRKGDDENHSIFTLSLPRALNA